MGNGLRFIHPKKLFGLFGFAGLAGSGLFAFGFVLCRTLMLFFLGKPAQRGGFRVGRFRAARVTRILGDAVLRVVTATFGAGAATGKQGGGEECGGEEYGFHCGTFNDSWCLIPDGKKSLGGGVADDNRVIAVGQVGDSQIDLEETGNGRSGTDIENIGQNNASKRDGWKIAQRTDAGGRVAGSDRGIGRAEGNTIDRQDIAVFRGGGNRAGRTDIFARDRVHSDDRIAVGSTVCPVKELRRGRSRRHRPRWALGF